MGGGEGSDMGKTVCHVQCTLVSKKIQFIDQHVPRHASHDYPCYACLLRLRALL